MAYRVSTTAYAERDLAHLYAQVNASSSGAGNKWYLGLKAAILSLEHQPNRCPTIRKKERLRHLLYGNRPNLSCDLPRHREIEAS